MSTTNPTANNALRRLRGTLVDLWFDRIEDMKQFGVGTPERRERMAAADALRPAIAAIDEELLAQEQPATGGHGDPQKDSAPMEGAADSQPQKSPRPIGDGSSGEPGSTPGRGTISAGAASEIAKGEREVREGRWISLDELRWISVKLEEHLAAVQDERDEARGCEADWHEARTRMEEAGVPKASFVS